MIKFFESSPNIRNIITSQGYLNYSIVEEKKKEIKDYSVLILPVWEVGFDDLYILADGHHRYQAAKELNIPIEFEEEKNPYGVFGLDLLESAWMGGSEWVYLHNGKGVW